MEASVNLGLPKMWKHFRESAGIETKSEFLPKYGKMNKSSISRAKLQAHKIKKTDKNVDLILK